MEDVKEGKDYSFPDEEVDILRFWDDIQAFPQQLKRTEGKPEFVFYDGPPFATGLPHYGHILAGTIKVSHSFCRAPRDRTQCRRTSSRAMPQRRVITSPVVLDGTVMDSQSNTRSTGHSVHLPFRRRRSCHGTLSV